MYCFAPSLARPPRNPWFFSAALRRPLVRKRFSWLAFSPRQRARLTEPGARKARPAPAAVQRQAMNRNRALKRGADLAGPKPRPAQFPLGHLAMEQGAKKRPFQACARRRLERAGRARRQKRFGLGRKRQKDKRPKDANRKQAVRAGPSAAFQCVTAFFHAP